MNKAQIVEIAKQSFYIEESAYRKLNQYLTKIGKHYNDQEVVDDIERSIAEKFRAGLKDEENVVTDSDIARVIEQLGTVEEITGIEESPNEKSNEAPAQPKRLFRDTENQQIAGVCSGLAAYLNVDVVLVRAIFVLTAIFVSGLGVIVYIVLWLVIPEAKTLEDRQAMRGDAGTIKDIEENVKRRAADLKDQHEPTVRSAVGSATTGIATLIHVFVKAAGLLIIIVGAVILAAIVSSGIGITLGIEGFSLESDFGIPYGPIDTTDYLILGSVGAAVAMLGILFVYLGSGLAVATQKLKALPIVGLVILFFAFATTGALLTVNNHEKWSRLVEDKTTYRSATLTQDFSRIVASDQVSVDIIESPTNQIEIATTEGADFGVEYRISNDTLYIENLSGFRFCLFSCGPRKSVKVYAHDIVELEGKDQVDIDLEGEFPLSSIIMSDQSSAAITLSDNSSNTVTIDLSDQSSISLNCQSVRIAKLELRDQSTFRGPDCQTPEFIDSQDQSSYQLQESN